MSDTRSSLKEFIMYEDDRYPDNDLGSFRDMGDDKEEQYDEDGNELVVEENEDDWIESMMEASFERDWE
jgi:hypothetical protein